MKLLLPLAMIVGLSGCTVSLQPFYLEGRWTDGETVWQVTRTGLGRFEIASCGETGYQADTLGVLFQSAGVTFLDFVEKPELEFSTAIHLHGVFAVHLRESELDLTVLDPELVSKLAERKALDTEFADTDAGIVLTARPENLQRWLVRH